MSHSVPQIFRGSLGIPARHLLASRHNQMSAPAADAPGERTLAAADVLAAQDALVAAAAAALPHRFDACTHALGPRRQAVYLCLTCTPPAGAARAGVCAACSIACHADHAQVELFPKRAFVCDCPTPRVPAPCALAPPVRDAPGAPPRARAPHAGNAYGPNFAGVFCRCGRAYDALAERETMVQCVACEVRAPCWARPGRSRPARTGTTRAASTCASARRRAIRRPRRTRLTRPPRPLSHLHLHLHLHLHQRSHPCSPAGRPR
jgi:hypothetical protein